MTKTCQEVINELEAAWSGEDWFESINIGNHYDREVIHVCVNRTPDPLPPQWNEASKLFTLIVKNVRE